MIGIPGTTESFLLPMLDDAAIHSREVNVGVRPESEHPSVEQDGAAAQTDWIAKARHSLLPGAGAMIGGMAGYAVCSLAAPPISLGCRWAGSVIGAGAGTAFDEWFQTDMYGGKINWTRVGVNMAVTAIGGGAGAVIERKFLDPETVNLIAALTEIATPAIAATVAGLGDLVIDAVFDNHPKRPDSPRF